MAPVSSDQVSIKSAGQASVRSASSAVDFTGYSRYLLPTTWLNAVNRFLAKGEGAEKKLGHITTCDIKERNGVAVHKSHYNPHDGNDIITAEITGMRGTRRCHIYMNGKGTSCKGDTPE